MPSSPRRKLSRSVQIYILVVSALGLSTLANSIYDLYQGPGDFAWVTLALLTVACGWLAVKLPSGLATISISETFVLSGTLMYGAPVGTALVVIDALVICLKEGWTSRQLRWQQVVFNAAAPAFSIWTGAHLARVNAVGQNVNINVFFAVQLIVFTSIYFLLNSSLVTVAIALERKLRPSQIWASNFKELSLNFAASASVAALVVSARRIDIPYLSVQAPLLFVIYFTYKWSAKRVQAEKDKNEQLNRVFLSTVEALALAIDAKDQVTHGHIRRVQRHTMEVAQALGVTDEKQLDAIRAAALLHDTRKLAVPEYILNKPGPLTASEFERMKVHADVGADILKSIDFPYPVEPIVRHHHESWNGTGYPQGLKGQEIPLGARILSVVDCYDALTSDRPYRPRYTRQAAEQILRERRGVMYDPWVVDGFLAILDKLENLDTKDQQAVGAHSLPSIPAQLEVISATQAEEREFNELRRELPRATSFTAAAEVLFRHLRRVVPAASLTLYTHKNDSNELTVEACSGVAASIQQGMTIPLGERISGWAFAHKQTVANSDAALELGPVAKTLSVPLRYATAVPLGGPIPGVVVAYGTEPFSTDHRRMLEGAATLFASSVSIGAAEEVAQGGVRPEGPASRSKDRVH
jgi:putative nucleotidyltransferase with HDIG domain